MGTDSTFREGIEYTITLYEESIRDKDMNRIQNYPYRDKIGQNNYMIF